MTEASAIQTEGLTKHYGETRALVDLDLEIRTGEIFGFLGPNGAGKSTTMKMITGFVAASAGTATVCGHDIATDGLEARQKMGYLPEGAPCYAEMTPGGFLEFIADVRGLAGADRKARLDEVIERLHLGPVLEQSIDTLSKGFKRRVGLAQAILHDPDVLILDEPTDGLDPNQKFEVRELIQSMSADKLIVISTHILEEVEAVCSRAIIIANGRILADDTPNALAARSRYHNAVRLAVGANAEFDEVVAAIENLAAVETTETDRKQGNIIAVAKSDSADMEAWNEVSALVQTSNWPVESVQLEAGRLNEVFRQITRGESA